MEARFFFFAALLTNFEVTELVDLTPGSGAACLAALYAAIPYTGFCHNDAHKEWLDSLMRRMFVAIVADEEFKVDQEVLKNVKQYLQRAAESARQMLPKKTAAFGASHSGEDDSNDEDDA